MALSVPPVPIASPNPARVVAAFDPNDPTVDINDPLPDLLIDTLAFAEDLRVVVAAIRTGLLTVDQTVTALLAAAPTGGGAGVPADIASALAGKADVATVAAIQGSLDAVTLALSSKLNTTTYNSKVSQLEAAITAATARSAHTGTQAASTITGLAPVATAGTYASLTGRPTIPTTPAEVGAQPAGSYASTEQLAGKLDASTAAIEARLPARLTAAGLAAAWAPLVDGKVPAGYLPPSAGGGSSANPAIVDGGSATGTPESTIDGGGAAA